MLWALGDDAVSAVVLGAHEAAVESAMAFLGDHAAFTRRGHGGLLQGDTEGLLAASFVHRTSRAADPQLHTHVLVANKVRALDGKWLSLDARELFAHQKAAGMLYKAALAAELTARCGVSWSAVNDNGIAEVEGVPEALCEAWSARRQVVKVAGRELVAIREAELGRSLTSSERAASFQLAAYRTRTPKIDAETPTATLKARWHEEAVAFGHDPDAWLDGVLDHKQVVMSAIPGADELATMIGRLEEGSATWTRADVVEECARLVTGADAADVLGRIEALAEEVLRDPEVVGRAAPLPAEAPSSLRRADGMAQFERHGGRRFTTTATLRREATVLEAAAAGTGARVRNDPDPRAGPDRRREIAALQRRDDLPAAVEAMRIGEQRLAAAEAGRREADDRAASSASLRARLPGRWGSDARRDQLLAENELLGARHAEQRALRDLEASRHRLETAERRHAQLLELHYEQRARDAYLAEHPEEADLARALRGLLRRDSAEPTRGTSDDGSHVAGGVDAGQPAREDVMPRRPVQGPVRGGPVIGR